jgi:cell division protein ZapB
MNSLLNKLKQFFKKPLGIALGLFIGILLFFVIIIKFTGSGSSAQIASKMQNQKEQPVQSNIRYTTQETLNTLTGETDNLTQSVSKLQQQFQKIKTDAVSHQKSMQDMVQQEIKALQEENQKLKDSVTNAITSVKKTQKSSAKSKSDFSYEINGAASPQATIHSDFVWVRDNAAISAHQTTSENSTDNTDSNSDSLLHSKANSKDVEKLPASSISQNSSEDKPKPIPYYTIPPDSWATGVIIEQPLIGVIPNNLSVLNPQTVTFAIAKKNLAANNWRLPAAISGIQGTAICQGVFVTFTQSYVQCDVTSLTFIFKDGRITTIKGTKDQPLGKITNRYGSPYIPGKYHGNAAFAATGTGFFSGLEGFGNAFAASQQQISQSAVSNFYQIKNTTKYGIGSAVGSMGEAWNDWWHDLLKSTTNFVYASNWDITTHKLKKFNIKISQAVPIDYDPNGRKINYANQIDTNTNNSLD